MLRPHHGRRDRRPARARADAGAAGGGRHRPDRRHRRHVHHGGGARRVPAHHARGRDDPGRVGRDRPRRSTSSGPGRRWTGPTPRRPRARPRQPVPRPGSKPPARRVAGRARGWGPRRSSSASLLLVACLCLGYLAYRRVRLMRGGGVDVCLAPAPAPLAVRRDVAAGWHFGVGRYHGDELAWYRLTSACGSGPPIVLDRTALEIVDRRAPCRRPRPTPSRTPRRCCTAASGGVDVELAMAPGVLTGFLSWLESAPPGRSTGVPPGLLTSARAVGGRPAATARRRRGWPPGRG